MMSINRAMKGTVLTMKFVFGVPGTSKVSCSSLGCSFKTSRFVLKDGIDWLKLVFSYQACE